MSLYTKALKLNSHVGISTIWLLGILKHSSFWKKKKEEKKKKKGGKKRFNKLSDFQETQ